MNDSSLERGEIETDWHKLYRNTVTTHSAVKNPGLASLLTPHCAQLSDDEMFKLLPCVSISIMNLLVLRQFLIDAGSDTGGRREVAPQSVLDILQKTISQFCISYILYIYNLFIVCCLLISNCNLLYQNLKLINNL